MSGANVNVVLQLIAALSDADYGRASEYLDADAEWHNTRVFPGPQVVVEAQAIRDFWEDMFEAYGAGSDDSAMEVEEVAEQGETVVVLVHGWGHGAASGIPFDTRWAHAVCVHNSKVLKVETYGRYESALEAAGIATGDR